MLHVSAEKTKRTVLYIYRSMTLFSSPGLDHWRERPCTYLALKHVRNQTAL